jgi:hypothetical protein
MMALTHEPLCARASAILTGVIPDRLTARSPARVARGGLRATRALNVEHNPRLWKLTKLLSHDLDEYNKTVAGTSPEQGRAGPGPRS